MSDEYLEFPGGAVRKEDVAAVQVQAGWGVHLRTLAAITAIILTGLFGALFVNVGLEAMTAPASENASLGTADFVIIAFWVGLIFLLVRGIDGFFKGIESRAKWAGWILLLAGVGIVGWNVNNLINVDYYPLKYGIPMIAIGILCAVSSAAFFDLGLWGNHKVHTITLRNGNIIKRSTWQ